MKQSFKGVLQNKHFTSCEVALSFLEESRGSLSNLLSPPTLGNISKEQPCLSLQKFYNGDVSEVSASLRLRYVWGGRAIHGLLVALVPEPETENLIIALTILAITIVFLFMLLYNPVSGFLISPFILFGALFGGIASISEAPLALGNLWAWASVVLLIVAYKQKLDGQFCTAAGMFSAFIWFMDGHFFLLVSLLAIVTYLLSFRRMETKSSLVRVFRNVFFVHIGFALCSVFFLFIKVGIFGVDPLIGELVTSASHRSSSVGQSGELINFISLVHKLLFVGYQNVSTYGSVFVWKTILLSTGMAFIVTIVSVSLTPGLFTLYKHYFLILILIASYIAIRLLVVPNHSFVHANMMSRYLSIPIACIWSAFLCCVHYSLAVRKS